MFRIESGDEYQNAILPSTLPLVALLNEWHTLNIQSGLKNAFITSTIPSSSKTITKTFSKLNQTIHTGIHHLNIITAKSCQLPMSFFDSSSSIEFNALITTSADKSLRVTCAVHSKVLTLATFQSSILTVSLHPKLRNILLTTSMDGTHGLLDLKTMEYQKIYKDHSKYVVASGFNNSGIYFATGSYDKTVKVYKQVDDGYDIAFTMTFGTAVESLCFIKRTDGNEFCCVAAREDNYLHFIELNDEFTYTRTNTNVNKDDWVSFSVVDVKPSFDQKYLLLYTDSTAGRLIIIDAETGQLVRDLWGTVVDGYDHSKCCWDATGERVFATSGDGKIWVFEVSSGKVLCKLEGHEGVIRGVYWDLEANWLVSCGYDQTVRVWSA